MKTMKKVLAVMMVLAMVMTLVPAAFADATTFSLTINGTTDGHTYDVYQIFVGDLDTNEQGKTVLSNVKYGKNYGTPGAVVPEEALNISDARAFADSVVVTGEAFKSNVSSAATSTVIDGLPAGYYLVKETTETVPETETYTKYILQVVGDTQVDVKSGTSSSYKKVDDKNDSTNSEDAVVWQDSADYDIGDAVPFQLTAVVASDYANYKSDPGYKLTFHDKEDAGLTFNVSSVKVYLNDSTDPLDSSYYDVSTSCTDGCTFEVNFPNLKNIATVTAGTLIHVEYTSTLNSNAVIGEAGNKNTSHITFTNNPYDNQAGETGSTPDDTVIVFTYKVVVNKVDEEGDPLTGAGFTLYKKNAQGNYVAVGEEIKGEELTTFEWKGIDDGDYKLSETTTPAGYNKIDDIEFKVAAGHVTDSATPTLTSLTGSTESGLVTFTATTANGTVSTKVENRSGATLPSTGGIGTTMFYVIGSVLVLFAGVMLVSKKRMGAAE